MTVYLNAGYLLWDVGATIITFLPGSYVKRSCKLVVSVADKASDFRSKKKDYPSVSPTPELHRKITKRWRRVVPYKKNYEKLTKEQLTRYCRIVYNDMPELRKVAIDSIIKYYKK